VSGEYKSTVIKPPMERIESGKIVKPSMKLLWKEYVSVACLAGFLWTIGVLFWLFVAYMSLVFDEDITLNYYLNVYIPTYWPLALIAGLGLLLLFVLPFWILYPLYFRNFEYSVISASGESMPEIYVKKGLLNITKKHVPFRTITNIASRAGPLDRIFGIGTVEIETAGYSGTQRQGPEEKMEGIVFYEEMRDFILQELRKFRQPYVTGTEIVSGTERPIPDLKDSLDDEILLVLREIRDLLKDKR
jgi:membrane protein YdbS with pleckstrin-like domain